MLEELLHTAWVSVKYEGHPSDLEVKDNHNPSAFDLYGGIVGVDFRVESHDKTRVKKSTIH